MTNIQTQASVIYPPLDGSIQPALLADFNLEHNPHRTLYAYSEGQGSLTEISFLEFGHAVHRASHLLRPGCAGSDGAVVAVIANTDIMLYQTVIAGLMRAGLVVCIQSFATGKIVN